MPDTPFFDDILTNDEWSNTQADQHGKSSAHAPQQKEADDSMPFESPNRPADLTAQIGDWLRESLSLAESLSLDNITSALQELEQRRRVPGFRLAFIGEFSRGKSTLINRLLGRAILPVGALPTTANLTSIVAGQDEGIDVLFPDGRREVRPLDESSWSDLVGTEQTDGDQKILAKVRLTLNHPWLRDNDIELIDTPGVRDLNSRRATLIFNLLSQSDGVVLVISATSPFSLTEESFLEQEVIGRHVPLVLVVISKLDAIAEEERAGIFQIIRERVTQVSPLIPVLQAGILGAEAMQDEALGKVRAQIEAMVFKGDRRIWRSRQVAGQISDHLGQLIEVGRGALAATGMEQKESQRILQEAKEHLRETELQWEQVRIELERRRLQCEQELRKRIFNTRTSLLDELKFKLKGASNPKSWIEQDLPFHLRREMTAFSRQMEDFLITTVSRDFMWLQTHVLHTFETQMADRSVASEVMLEPEMPPALPYLELKDTQRMRLFSRVGSGVATIVGHIFIAPIATALSLVAGIAGEDKVDRMVQQQRDFLERQLESHIDRFLDEYASRVSERLRQFYDQLAEDTKREQSTWLKAKINVLEASNGGRGQHDEQMWQRAIDRASALRGEISAALQR